MANIRVKNKHRRPRASAPNTTSTILQPLAPKNVHGAEKCPNINISINTTFKIGSIAKSSRTSFSISSPATPYWMQRLAA